MPQQNMAAMLEKTELCRRWKETGSCPFGDNCRFAHGEAELRPKDERIQRLKTQKMCIAYHTEGCCYFGGRCTFIHDFDIQCTGWKLPRDIGK